MWTFNFTLFNKTTTSDTAVSVCKHVKSPDRKVNGTETHKNFWLSLLHTNLKMYKRTVFSHLKYCFHLHKHKTASKKLCCPKDPQICGFVTKQSRCGSALIQGVSQKYGIIYLRIIHVLKHSPLFQRLRCWTN